VHSHRLTQNRRTTWLYSRTTCSFNA